MVIALYARQSVERENSVSIATQLDFCRAMIKPDERELPVTAFIDEGCSGGNLRREGFQRMMAAIENGGVHKVITYKLDRISRSLSDFVGILQTFQAHQVEFVSSQEAFDTSSLYGDLILKILIVFAEFERTSIINRVRDAYAKRTDLGLYMGGRRQYGFTLEETVLEGIVTKKYVPIAAIIPQLRYIFEYYAQENTSLRSLLTALVEQDSQPYQGAAWTTAKLSALLKNPIYVQADGQIYDYYEQKGVRIVNELAAFDGSRAAQLYGKSTHNPALADWSDMKLVLAQHEGIIPAATWLACQRKLARNKQIGNSLANRTSWLGGKLICSQCGRTMTTIKSPRSDGTYRRYFHCTGKSHQKTCPGVQRVIYAADLERLVETAIAQKLPTLGPIRQPVASSRGEANSLLLQWKAIDLQQKKLADLLLSEQLNADLLTLANQKAALLCRQKEALEIKLQQQQEQAAERQVPLELSSQWAAAGYAEKKAVTQALIQRIILYPDGTPEIVWQI